MFFLLIALTSEAFMFGATAPEITVRTIGGDATAGKLIDWTEKEVVVDTPQGEQRIAVADLVRINFAAVIRTADGPSPGRSTVKIEFVDQVELASPTFIAGESEAEFLLGATKMRSVPLASIRSVCFASSDQDLQQAWERLCMKPRRADRLAVRKGKAIDYVDGVISKVTPEQVDFLLDGELLPVKRTKLVGLLFADREAPAMQPAKCQLVTVDGSRIPLSTWKCLPEGLEVRSPAGLPFDLPYADVSSIDFLHEKIVYLSELEPLIAEWTPYLAVGKLGPTLARFYRPHKDRLAGATEQIRADGRLEIVSVPAEDSADGSPRPSVVESYAEGLALHSKSYLVFDLPPDARRFESRVGIDASTVHLGNVHFQVLGDGQSLYAEDISGRTGPRDVSVDVSGVRRLEIRVDFGENQDVGDRLNLCNARIVK